MSILVAAFVGCVIIGDIPPGLCDWPEGTYGIPAHKDGCPNNDGPYRWKLGSVLQKTEYGSHTSGDVHLFGMTDGPSDTIQQCFCMKTSYGSYKNHHFLSGKYCILKFKQCPARFQEGWIYWDDAGPWFGPTIQNTSGVLPDGDYKRNTRIEYCCRLDGDTKDPIALPATEPFYLMKYGDQCQEVADMNVAEEWVYWAGEKSWNLDEERGVHPKTERQKFPHIYTKLFYCYYTPKPRVAVELSLGPGFETFLMVLCVIGAILGVIFLTAVVLASIQKALIFRQQRRDQQQQQRKALNVQNERMIGHQIKMSTKSTKPSEGSALPEYSSYKTTESVPFAETICLEKVKDLSRKDIPAQTAAALDDHSSVDSLNMHPDAESEAPPSYDEVFRDGHLKFVV